MNMKRACAVTGHRPTRFKFKYQEDYSLCKKIKKAMREQFMKLYDEEGVHRVYVGGTLGVDMWAGEIVLRLKETPGYEDIELVVVLPFPNHDTKWDERSRRRLRFLIRHSIECITVGVSDSRDSYVARNCYMVDNSDFMLAVYDNDRGTHTDPIQIVYYAEKENKRIIMIHPDTAEVTENAVIVGKKGKIRTKKPIL